MLNSIGNDDYAKLKFFKEELNIQESKLRSNLATTLLSVRSGKSEVSDLEALTKNFQTGDYSPEKINTALESFGDLIKKVKFTKTIVANGAKYIGHGSDLDDELLKDYDAKTFVFYFSKRSCVDTSVWIKNREIFYQELRKKNEGCKAYVVDCDIYPDLIPSEKSSCIMVVQRGHVLTEDLRIDQAENSSIPFAQTTLEAKRVLTIPTRRAPLRLPCPGKSCSVDNIFDWICRVCKSPLEWGIDKFVYCKCGMTSPDLLEFKCPKQEHGIAFEKHYDPEYYQGLLGRIEFQKIRQSLILEDLNSKLNDHKELNILVLGSPVEEKCTWINSLANFIKYADLEETEANDPVTVFPSKFFIFGEDHEEYLVEVSQNMGDDIKVSHRTDASTISLRMANTTLNLIITFNKAAGNNQDLEYILKPVSHLKHLHGVCMFLNENSVVEAEIRAVLKRLHQNLRNNIVFCFTNPNPSTFHGTQDGTPVLKKLQEGKDKSGIEVSPDTIYYLDCDAYRYLAVLKYGSPDAVSSFKEKMPQFSELWDKCKEETFRIFARLCDRPPQPIEDTITLNRVQNYIENMKTPIQKIIRNLQFARVHTTFHQEELAASYTAFKSAIVKHSSFGLKNMENVQHSLDEPTRSKLVNWLNRKKEYEAELKEIFATSVGFACFVEKHSAARDDSDQIREFLNHLLGLETAIRTEAQGGANFTEALKDLVMSYPVLKDCAKSDILKGVRAIDDRINKLKALKHSGKDFKNSLRS